MPGFIVIIKSKIKAAASTETGCLIESKSSGKYCIERRTNRKFENDKFFYENDNYIFLLDGVVFNNHLLVEKYNASDWRECVEIMHSKKPRTFYNEFRGSFLGFVYDKRKDEWLFYTDHIGDKQIFYAHLSEGGCLVATEMSYMVDTMRLNGQKLTPNRDAAYMAITLGYVIENNTLVEEISKLVAGHYLVLSDGNVAECQYHRFSNVPIERTKEEMIEEIDRRFRHAIQLQFEKDKEYGYRHVTGLSGGLDSRMTVWVAHELGYTHQLNMTFCQSNYIDFQVAQEIATDLRHDFIFKALDGGNCIYEIDKVSKLTYGMACFFGLAHGKSLFDNFNYKQYGVVHTGMLGDVIVGSYMDIPQYRSASLLDGAYSIELIDRLKDYSFKYQYDNAEIYMMYNRGFGFCGQGTLSYDHCQTENFSPFCDVDFMEFCFSIPLDWRCNHKIYHEWILAKYPQAANYVWEKIGMTIKEYKNQQQNQLVKRRYMHIFGMQVPAPNDPYFGEYVNGFVLRKLGLRKKVGKRVQGEECDNHTFMLLTKKHMNPVDYWYYGNPELRDFMDNYWKTNRAIIKDRHLLGDMTYLYEDCKATYDKLQPLTVLAACKLIYE